MPSTSQTLVFGGYQTERFNSQTESMVPYGKVFGKTAMSDLTKSCGVEVVSTESSVDVIQQLMLTEAVQQSFGDTYFPFTAIFEEDTISGYKGKPLFVYRRLMRASSVDQTFPQFPDLDISPLYDFLPFPPGMDAEASRRLSFGLIVGSKKFAIKGREFYQSNFLEHFPSHQENAFGYNASYWSVSKEIYAWHMKERGLRHVVLIDGYKKIGRNHSDTSNGVKIYSLEETMQLLHEANAAGGSPPLPSQTDAPQETATSEAPVTEPTPQSIATESPNESSADSTVSPRLRRRTDSGT
jgi:hypothetical protein